MCSIPASTNADVHAEGTWKKKSSHLHGLASIRPEWIEIYTENPHFFTNDWGLQPTKSPVQSPSFTKPLEHTQSRAKQRP